MSIAGARPPQPTLGLVFDLDVADFPVWLIELGPGWLCVCVESGSDSLR